MSEVTFRGRRAVSIENELLRITVLVEGGHVAEILDKPSGLNPLWIPPWPSIEPSAYDPARHAAYGTGPESRLLAGIMGHNLCLDLFGPPSPEEAAAGRTVHGEASVAPYDLQAGSGELVARAHFPVARLALERRIRLAPDRPVVRFTETVENLSAADHPIAWTQHVTLGPPFLEKGATEFRIPAARSKVFEGDFAGDKGALEPGAAFEWPYAPRRDGGAQDLRVLTGAPASGAYTAHLMDPRREHAFFLAFSPARRMVFGYVWHRADFPWLGIWEENYSRANPPWNGTTLALGMEFGVSPMPEPRRSMIERGTLFGVPCYRWLPARSRLQADYCAFLGPAEALPDSVRWDGEWEVVW